MKLPVPSTNSPGCDPVEAEEFACERIARNDERRGLRAVPPSGRLVPRRSILLVCLLLAAVPARAGVISGVVRAEGKPEAEQEAAGGKYASRRYKFAERIDYSQLRDFVVSIDQPLTNFTAGPAKTVQVITQRDATFKPHVLPVVAGTTVEWPNHDQIFHNVFSVSEGNDFDLGLYKDPEIKAVPFRKAGRVDVFCSIHTRMNCIILVLPNPCFALADDKGRYAITNVPPGTYKVKAWHERLPSLVREITVPEKGEVKADFTLGIVNLPKY